MTCDTLGLDRFDLDVDVDRIAGERIAVIHPPLRAVDRRFCRVGDVGTPFLVRHSTEILRIQGDGMRLSMHRQIAGHRKVRSISAGDFGAGKLHRRIRSDIEEMGRAQVGVTIRVTSVDS